MKGPGDSGSGEREDPSGGRASPGWAVPTELPGGPRRFSSDRLVRALVAALALAGLFTVLTGALAWVTFASGRGPGESLADVVARRQGRAMWHFAAGALAVVHVVALGTVVAWTRKVSGRLLAAIALALLAAVAVVASGRGAREHLIGRDVEAAQRDAPAADGRRFLPGPWSDGAPPSDPVVFWLHVAVAPLVLGGAVWLGLRRAPAG